MVSSLMAFTEVLSTLLVALVAGVTLTFAIVVMPGIASLNNRDYLRAFQVMDRVIQQRQPIFMIVWLGSVLSLMASAAIGISQLEGMDRVLQFLAIGAYLIGVQLPTAVVNVPLNNRLQGLNLEAEEESSLERLRKEFETKWIPWNTTRAIVAVGVAVTLLGRFM